jgi:DNA topoisomerase-1
MSPYAKLASDLLSKPALKPNEGEKVDSAHPAIYPTGNFSEKPLGAAERNVFDLVIRRFMAAFGEPALRQKAKVTVNVNGNNFHLGGVRTLMNGWIPLYEPYARVKDAVLPPLNVGKTVNIKKVILKNDFTKPPSRYNPRSLLLKMEKENIGTKATRAATIQTLQDRKYVSGTGSFVVSDLGSEVVEILTNYCPSVVSPELTRSLEQEMGEIQEGKGTKEAILRNVVSILKSVMMELKANELVIGQLLGETIKKARLEERTVGTCPKCSGGKLVILRSHKTGKRFVGCTNYFEGKCKVTFPLPQKGVIKPLSTPCRCGHLMINVWLRGRHSWKLCLNPDCPTKGAAKP